MKATITSWPSLLTTTGRVYETGWEALFDSFSRREDFRGDLHPGWSPAGFRDGKRGRESVLRVFALVLDVDGGWSIQGALEAFAPCYGFLHTSKSHTDDVHRFRLILPFSRSVSAFEYDAIWRRVEAVHPGRVDPACKDPSRFWYTPGVLGDAPYETHRLTGQPLDPDAILSQPEPRPTPERRPAPAGLVDVEERARRYIAKMPEAISGSGGHLATWRVALALAKGFALPEDRVLELLRHEYNRRCTPLWSERELAHKAANACASKAEHGYLLGPAPREPAPESLPAEPMPVAEPEEDYEAECEAPPPPFNDEPEPPPPAWKRVGVRRLCDSLRSVYEGCQRPSAPPSCSTGNAELDKLMGGYRPKQITIVGAETSWGKSSWIVMAFDEADAAGKRMLVVSGEDDEETFTKRLAARRSGLSGLRLRDECLDDHERERLFRVVATSSLVPWFLDGIGRSSEKLARDVGEVLHEATKAGEPYDVVAVDYAQCFRANAQDRRNEVTKVAREFVTPIKVHRAAGIITSQIVRPERAVRNWEPDEHSLKESGDLENMAETVLLGWTRDGEHSITGEPEIKRLLKIGKNKNGPRLKKTMLMPFDDRTASFRRVGP